MEATIFDFDISLLRNTLEIQHTYIISNAKVSAMTDRFNKFKYPYQWTISRRTAVQPENYAPISMTNLNYKYT